MHSFCLFVAAFTTLISQSLFVWRLRLFGIYQSIQKAAAPKQTLLSLYALAHFVGSSFPMTSRLSNVNAGLNGEL